MQEIRYYKGQFSHDKSASTCRLQHLEAITISLERQWCNWSHENKHVGIRVLFTNALLCPEIQHPQVSIFSHPGGRWRKAVWDVWCSATHNAVEQPSPHRCKSPLHQLTFKPRSKKKCFEQDIFPSSSRPQQPRTWQNPCLQMMVTLTHLKLSRTIKYVMMADL